MLGGEVIVFSEEFEFCEVVNSSKLIPKVKPVEVAASWRDDMIRIRAKPDFIRLRRHFKPGEDLVDHQTPCASSVDARLKILSGDLIRTLGQPTWYLLGVTGYCSNRKPQTLCIIRVVV